MFKHYISILCAFAILLLSSCSRKTEEEPAHVEKPVRVTLIYAVNHSSLAKYFVEDREEMEEGVLSAPAGCRLLLYCTDSDRESDTFNIPVLLEAQVDEDAVSWKVVKRYDKNGLSTDPERMAQVISDALARYPDARYDLFFWGHGSAWTPGAVLRAPAVDTPADRPDSYGYGGEYDAAYNSVWTDIDELAAAIPEGKIETLWFDCCYMANIETIYELSGKCDTFVGYPTEVWGNGLDYKSALSYMMRKNPDIVGGAKAFFNFYNSNHDPVTATVVDMTRLERLADASKAILESGEARPETYEMINYSRHHKYYNLYDFGTYMRLTARLNADEVRRYERISEFDEAMKSAILWYAASPTDFNGRLWDTDAISGMSTHYFTDADSESDRYYRKLKWFSRVYN